MNLGMLKVYSTFVFLRLSFRKCAPYLLHWLPVDSQLAKQSSLTAVSEILNGCMSVSLEAPPRISASALLMCFFQVLHSRRSDENSYFGDPRCDNLKLFRPLHLVSHPSEKFKPDRIVIESS